MGKRFLRTAICLLCGAPAGLAHAGQAPATAPAADEGRLLFAIVYRAGPAWQAGKPIAEQGLGDHARYMKQLVDDGVVHTAGPWGPDGGIVLLRAADLMAAQMLVDADPAVKTGLFIGEVRRFAPRFTSPAPLGPR